MVLVNQSNSHECAGPFLSYAPQNVLIYTCDRPDALAVDTLALLNRQAIKYKLYDAGWCKQALRQLKVSMANGKNARQAGL